MQMTTIDQDPVQTHDAQGFLDIHEFFIDPRRCIGCQACVQACSECDTHKGTAMIHLDFVDPSRTPQTVPVICMHCDRPMCAEVCPADAIKKTDDGIVQSARKERCLGCNNCGLACPFGVPKVMTSGPELMMKCDMCYDRTSIGKTPMCASVCPSGALFFGTQAQIEQLRPRSQSIQSFQLGDYIVRKKVKMLVGRDSGDPILNFDAAYDEGTAFDAMADGLYDPERDLFPDQETSSAGHRFSWRENRE